MAEKDEDSLSPINNEPESDWTNLATEVLMMIFNKLKYDVERNSVLKPRLVHPRWKLVMDELLEKWCLEYWTKWKGEYPGYHMHPYNFPSTLKENLLFDRASPTKSVCVIGKVESELVIRSAFANYGTNLTSLTLISTGGPTGDPFAPRKLVEILRSTPNLKAIAFQHLDFKLDEICEIPEILLPPLPHLEHVKLWDVDQVRCMSFRFNFIRWLMNPYKKQLVTLETNNYEFDWGINEDGVLPYENLKRLKVWRPPTQLLNAQVRCPPLQCLSLRWQESYPNFTLQLVQKFISNFSATLVDLHLDIMYGPPRTRVLRKIANEEEVGVSNLTFPVLKTFGIFYPQSDEEVGLVKHFLKMFPRCETLKFFLHAEERSKIDWSGRENPLVEHQYWRLCPTLKIISVQLGGGYPHGPRLSIKAPIS